MDHRSEHEKGDAPLARALAEQKGRVSFHMPGHRPGSSFLEPPFDRLFELDTTELPRTGDLAAPSGHVEEAYQLAADYFGAGRTWFITSGTTASIHIMIAATLREGDFIIIPRAVHIAAVHALALMGVNPIFVLPEKRKSFPDGQPDVASYVRTIQKNPNAKACFVTRPDYFGRTIDLSMIVKEAEKHDMLVLVDEAHGAHLAAAPDLLPQTGLFEGADIVCQSAHKTLPALTPASLLHLSQASVEKGAVDPLRVAQKVKVFQTSSPSFLIGASIDRARQYLHQHGREAIERLIQKNDELTKNLPPYYQRILPEGSDRTRLVLDYSKTGHDRRSFIRHLDLWGIDPELVDLSRAVFIMGLEQSDEDYERLLEALITLKPISDKAKLESHQNALERLTRERDQLLSESFHFHVPLREAMFGQKPDESVAVAPIAPYPPGLPIIWPGEKITRRHQNYLAVLSAGEVVTRGAELVFV